MRTLILTVGLPQSGKSTWAREQGMPIVNPDSIRLALHGEAFIKLAEPYVWAIARTMVQALFLAGHEYVIVDATNTTKKRRDFWTFDYWSVTFKPFTDVDHQTCISRAIANNRDDLVPVINRMTEAFEPLELTETCWVDR